MFKPKFVHTVCTFKPKFVFFLIWTSLSPLLFHRCYVQIKVRNKVKRKHSLSRSQIYTLHRCPWLAGCLYAYKLVLPLEKPQKILTAEGWTRWYVPLTSCSSNLDSTSCSLGDKLVPPGMTFHLPISDVLEQEIYRNVTRKSENSQLELLLLVHSSVRHCIQWSSAQVLCLLVGSETELFITTFQDFFFMFNAS